MLKSTIFMEKLGFLKFSVTNVGFAQCHKWAIVTMPQVITPQVIVQGAGQCTKPRPFAVAHGFQSWLKSQRWSGCIWREIGVKLWLSWLKMLNLLLRMIWNDLKWSASIFWLKWSEMQIFQRLKYWNFLDEASRDFGCKCVNHWLLCVWVLVHFLGIILSQAPKFQQFPVLWFFFPFHDGPSIKVNLSAQTSVELGGHQIQDFFRGQYWSAWGSSWLWRPCHSRRFWGLASGNLT